MISLSKPLAELYLLDECFSAHGIPFELANDAILTFNKIDPNNITLVLLQGEIAISRKYNDVLLVLPGHRLSRAKYRSYSTPIRVYIYAQNECSGYYIAF